MENNDSSEHGYDDYYRKIEHWGNDRKFGTWWEYWEDKMKEASALIHDIAGEPNEILEYKDELLGLLTSRIKSEIEWETTEWRRRRRHGEHFHHIEWMIKHAPIPEPDRATLLAALT